MEQLKPEKKGFRPSSTSPGRPTAPRSTSRGPFGKDDANVVRIFGKAKLAVAFRGDAIVGAFGEHAVGSVRKAVEGLSPPAAPESGAVGPVALVARLSGFDAFPDNEKEARRTARRRPRRSAGEDAKKDRFSMSLKGEGTRSGSAWRLTCRR